MSHHIVDFNNLCFSYPDGKQTIHELNVRILHGESVGIVGANGAGKSTMLLLLAGILKPDAGEIRIGETPVTKKTLPIIRQKLGFVFQNSDDQLFMNSVYEDVAFGPRNYGLDEAEVDKRVLKALETVGITHLKDRPPYKLSGGEKRAASIATVLSMEPDILVMDEPSAALDLQARRRLINLLNGFQHTKIIASHDVDMVLELCERTIVLYEGSIVKDGKTIEVLTDDALLERCRLERPMALKNCPVCGGKKFVDVESG